MGIAVIAVLGSNHLVDGFKVMALFILLSAAELRKVVSNDHLTRHITMFRNAFFMAHLLLIFYVEEAGPYHRLVSND